MESISLSRRDLGFLSVGALSELLNVKENPPVQDAAWDPAKNALQDLLLKRKRDPAADMRGRPPPPLRSGGKPNDAALRAAVPPAYEPSLESWGPDGGLGNGQPHDMFEEFVGTVKRHGEQFGFIDSEPAKARFGRDVYFSPKSVSAEVFRLCSEGLSVTFCVMLERDGKPIAHRLRILDLSEMQDASGEFHIGIVKRMGKDFGFIASDETYALYQRDIYFAARTVGVDIFKQIQEGVQVRFSVQFEKDGKPVGCRLTPIP